MLGSIRTQEKCPICGGEFKDTFKDLECPQHKTSPKIYLVDWSYKGIRFKKYGFRSYQDCVDFLVKVTNEIKYKRFDPKNYITKFNTYFRFDLFVQKWLEARHKEVEKQKIAPSYYVKIKRYASMFINFYGSEDIRELKTYRIKEFYESLSNQLSPKTQKNILSCLHKVFTDAYDMDLITDMPKFPRIEVPDPAWAWIPEETQLQVLMAIPKEHRPFIYFMSRYGVRPGEARALGWEDVDYKNDLIHIRKNFSLNEHRKITKTRKIRTLPMFPDIREVLKALPRAIGHNFVFTKKGLPYSESYARKLWNEACKKVGVEGVSLYAGTRHSVASQLVNRGVSLEIIGSLLGHTNTRMTQRYSHVVVDAIRNAMEK